jgi:N-acetylneuraminate synthase
VLKNLSVQIAGRQIGHNAPPYIIAELSANHSGSLDKALKLITEAKTSGADAVKLQTYTADTLTLDSDAEEFQIRGGLWDGKSLYQLYKEAHTPWEWHKALFDHARRLGITIFSSPFDTTAVDFLEDLDTPAYKVASFEIVDLPLIKYMARTGKPIIISTGMASAGEIEEAIEAARSNGCTQLILLHCVSGYPAAAAEYNLSTLQDMQSRFGTIIGLSDHTLDSTTAIASVALGACVIEKHFTLDRSGGGPDDSFSIEPSELSALKRCCDTAWEAVGKVEYSLQPSEKKNLQFRRSLYYVKDMSAGDLVTRDSIRSVRPGSGLPPKLITSLVGRRLKCAVKKHTPPQLDHYL